MTRKELLKDIISDLFRLIIFKATMGCIECNNEISLYKKDHLCNKCYKKQYYLINKTKIDSSNKANRLKNKKELKERCCPNCNISFIPSRKDRIYCGRYCADKYSRLNRKEAISVYFKEKYNTDVNRKISSCLRSRLNKALKGKSKKVKYNEYLGCTTVFLKSHLESKWLSGMSWENHSVHGWHIDHIRPLSSFDLSKKEEQKQACHYTNLQPLWAKDNLSKGNKYE